MAIEISRLRRQYGRYVALDDVSLSIADGEFIAVLGPSGSGKTSLLRILAGLDQPDAGDVRRDNQDLLALDARQRGVGLVFQHYALFPHMTVAQNVAFGLRVRPWRQRPRAGVIKARVNELLQRVELATLADRYPAQLSGGQRQRVALARALAIEPRLLLLDEPFGALDAQVRVNLRRWLRELHRSLGITTLFVTHDQEEALEMADRVVVMNAGRIEQIGTPEEIFRHPATPFASRFIARAQLLPVTVSDGMPQLLGRALPMEHPLREQAISAYVRPEDVHVVPQHADGWSARVVSVRHVAGSVRASLAVAGVEEPLEAEWSERDWARYTVAAGDVTGVHFQTVTVFGSDGDGRARSCTELHPAHIGAQVAVGPWRRLEA